MKKILVGMLATLCMILATLTVATPAAQAQVYDNVNSKTLCASGGSVTVCAYITWRRQDDGDGIYMEALHVWTSNGCGDLEEDGGGKMVNVDAWTNKEGQTAHYQDWDWGYEDCSWVKDMEARQADNGPMEFHLNFKARINLQDDKRFAFLWTPHANGDDGVTYAGTFNV